MNFNNFNIDYVLWLGLAFLFIAFLASFKRIWSLTWKSAIGKMKTLTVRPFNEGNSSKPVTKYAVEFLYEYEVDGKKEKGTAYISSDKAHVVNTEAEARKFSVDYAPDSRVVVFYNPLLPSDSLLKRGRLFSSLSLIFIGLAAVTFYAYSWFWQRDNSPEALEIYRAQIQYSIDVGIKKRERVYQFDLSWRTLNTIPKELERFPNLEVINLSNNSISSIPKGFIFPGSLLRLNLSQNKFTEIPSGLEKHPGLKHLDLSSNQITSESNAVLPRSLSTLDLSNNQLRSLSEYLVRSPHLDTIYARNNLIDSLPARLYFDSLYDKEPPTLKVLDLRGNPISPTEHERILSQLPQVLVLLDSLPPKPEKIIIQPKEAYKPKKLNRKRWGL